MKIVYIIPELSYPGGIGRVTSNKANYWKSKGHDVSIITDIQGTVPDYYALDQGIQHFDLGFKTTIFSRIKKLYLWRKYIKNKLEELRPDIVVYTFFKKPVACSFKYKSVVECHFNHEVNRLQEAAFHYSVLKKIANRILEFKRNKCLRFFDFFCVLSNEDRMLWESSGNYPNIHVIPNMQSFTCDTPSSLKYQRVIAVGRYDAQKSFDRLIHIWARVVPYCHGACLDIFGQGPDREIYQSMIEELRLSSSVRLMPPVKDIRKEYLNSSLLCFTSTYEGFSMVLIEAMTCGLPVISYDVPCGPKDIITDGINGFLVKDRDEETYANRIVQILNDDNLRKQMGMMAYKKANEEYSMEKVMKKWEKLLNSFD